MVLSEDKNYFVITLSENYITEVNSHDILFRRLDRIDFKNNFIFFINQYELFSGPNKKSNIDTNDKIIIKLIKKYHNLALRNNLQFKIIFAFMHEAPTYENDYKFIIDYIVQNSSLNYKDISIICGAQNNVNAIVKNFTTQYIAFCNLNVADLLNYNCKHIPTHHFVSLARIARPHRIISTVELLDRKLDTFGYFSLGSGFYKDPNENKNLNLVTDRYKNLFPAYIDGPQINHGGNEHVFDNEKITRAFVNLVQESSYDREISSDYWTVPFMTEKSTKPFALGQAPIFISCYNSLSTIRSYGFDLFDDIIDHSYDNELDPHKRILLAIDQLEKICKTPLQYWVDFKEKNNDRFVKNYKIVTDYVQSMGPRLTQDLQKAIDE
jgi:hypothetical protein